MGNKTVGKFFVSYFFLQDAEQTNILEVLDGLTQLRLLTWGVFCPIHAFEDRRNENIPIRLSCVTDKTGTLTAVKDKLQACLPNTEIVILPCLTANDVHSFDDNE